MKNCFFKTEYSIYITSILAIVLLLAIGAASADSKQLNKNKQDTGRSYVMTDKKEANIGKIFPEVSAKTLEGKPAKIPDDAKGRVTLVTVAFLRESQSQLDSWLNPFYETFGKRDGFMFYEVPMISSGYKFMKLVIDGGMRSGLPEFKHKHVMTMYGDVEKYAEALKIDPQKGHAFLLDKEGVICWQGEGFATAELIKELSAVAEKLSQ